MSGWSLSAITTEMAVAAACAVVAGFAFFIWLPRRRGLEGRAQAVEGKGRGVPEDSFVSQLVTRLVCEWYGVKVPEDGRPPPLKVFSDDVDDAGLVRLWDGLWFATGEKQSKVDEELRDKFGRLFDFDVTPFLKLGGQVRGKGWREREADIVWRLGWMLLYDQVARNVFRRTPDAYQEEKAKQLANAILPYWERLSPPMLMSLALVFIHSEHKEDLPMLDDIMARARIKCESLCPTAWRKLYAIYENQKHLMGTFGRIPERNAFLGRPSTELEQEWGL